MTWTDLCFKKDTRAVSWIDGGQKWKLRDQRGEYFSAPDKGGLDNGDSCRGTHKWTKWGYIWK